MRNRKIAALSVIAIAAAAIGGFAFNAGTAGAADQTKPPLVIAREGYIFAGGHYDKDHANHHMIGQVYADYQIPAKQTHPYPIVMIHGGSQSGVDFLGTPDGREGWAQYFLRRGYAVYVVDQVGRGKSPYDIEAYGPMDSQSYDYTLQKFVAPEKFNFWPQAKLHTQWPGKAEPGDPAFDQFFASSVPSMKDRDLQGKDNVAALAALLDKIGPSIVLVHSQSGQYGWPLVQARPLLVKALVAAEPAGPPVHDIVFRSAAHFDVGFDKALKENDQDIFRDNPDVKTYGLTNIPLAYLPAVTKASPLEFVQQDKSERPDFARCWRQKEPARKLVALADHPIMILGTEASFYAGYTHCNVEYLEQAGAHPDYVKLADIGIHGNGHMMMLEKNSDQIAGVIENWLEKHVPANGKAGDVHADAR